jgi:hypothetical protein
MGKYGPNLGKLAGPLNSYLDNKLNIIRLVKMQRYFPKIKQK